MYYYYNNLIETCEQNRSRSVFTVYDVEHGIIRPSDNGTSFWTIFTLTCSSVGIALSTAALALLILTALLFPEWRRSYKNQLLIQFMFARFAYTSIRFFSEIQYIFKICPATTDRLRLNILIMIYTELTLVIWMFVFTRQMYISLVKVFDSKVPNIWRVSACAWLGPAVIALVLHIIFSVSQDTVPMHFIFSLMLVKWPILITNAVLLILILRSVLVNNKKSGNNLRIIVVMLLLIFVFCFQQMLSDVAKIIFVIIVDKIYVISTSLLISNILAMFHCAFSTLFWVLGNANTRKLWKFEGKDLRSKIRLSARFSV